MNEYARCRYCRHGVSVPVDKKSMCMEKGIVSWDAVCPKFSLDPFKIKVQRHPGFDFSRFKAEDFSIE